MPLYPLVLKATSLNYPNILLGQILNLILVIFGIFLLTKIFPEFNNKKILLFLSLPTSFFLLATYSESLFLFLILLNFYGLKSKKNYLVILATSLSLITRITAVSILFVNLYFYLKNKNFKIIFALLFSPLLLLAYSFYNYFKYHDFLYFINAHKQLGNARSSNLVNPLQTLWRYLKILTTLSPAQHEWGIALLEILSLILIIFLLFKTYKKIKTEYLIFISVSLLIPILSGTLTGFPRYILPVMPFLISKINLSKNYYYLIIAIFFSLQLLLFALFAKGYFIA